MNTSPRLQAFMTLLCQRHGVDVAQHVAGDYLHFENEAGDAALRIAFLEEGQIMVAYRLWYEDSLVIDLEMLFLVTLYGWEPVSVQDCFARSWDEFWTEAGREGIAAFDETGMLILPSMTEYWADRLHTWGWLRKGLLEDGKFAALAAQTPTLSPAGDKTSRKTPASHTAPVTESLTQASLFEG